MSINFHFGKNLESRYVPFLAKVMPKYFVNFSVTNYMNFNFRSKMLGDHNEKVMCSNSPAQEKENVVEEYAIQEEVEAALEFLQDSCTDGNDADTSATDGNGTTTGTESTKLKKQCRERRRNKLDNITDIFYEAFPMVSLLIRPLLQLVMAANADLFFEIPFRSM
jgi:hypothetical protein